MLVEVLIDRARRISMVNIILQVLALGLFLTAAEAVSFKTVTNVTQLAWAKKTTRIRLLNVFVPAGESLDLTNLLPGTTVEFWGTTKFGYKEWKGPLIKVTGDKITIRGMKGHTIDCEGQRWWDGIGGNGGKVKPLFFHTALTNSHISRLNVLNYPVHGFAINGRNIKVTGVRMDNKLGHLLGGHNTDGFDVANADRVTISHCYVDNQDDCLALNSGTNIQFVHNTCKGGHGISVVPWGRDYNVVENVTIKHCKVEDADIGVRVKSMKYGKGLIKNVIYEDITLKNIKLHGIIVQGNYLNSGPVGDPTDGVPIVGLTIKSIYGTVLPSGTDMFVFVHDKAPLNWYFKHVHVHGGKRKLKCKGVPRRLRKMTCG